MSKNGKPTAPLVTFAESIAFVPLDPPVAPVRVTFPDDQTLTFLAESVTISYPDYPERLPTTLIPRPLTTLSEMTLSVRYDAITDVVRLYEAVHQERVWDDVQKLLDMGYDLDEMTVWGYPDGSLEVRPLGLDVVHRYQDPTEER